MTFTLQERQYQLDCFAANVACFGTLAQPGRFSRIFDVVPTGGGKTIIFSQMTRWMVEQGGRVLIVAHRTTLIEQALAKLLASTGIRAEREQADDYASLGAKVVVACSKTLAGRFNRFPKDHFDLIICDEAHHCLADEWQVFLNYFCGREDGKKTRVLGVTATPERGDLRNLGAFFEHKAYEIGLFDLINLGFLAPIVKKFLPIQIDLEEASQRLVLDAESGELDFSKRKVAAAIEPHFKEIALAVLEHAAFRRTLAFLPLIETSRKFVEVCRSVGLNAVHVDGQCSPEEQALISRRLAEGELDLVSNAALWSEGYDNPAIDCVLPLRLTRVWALYWQWIGRGTRICRETGKKNLLLFDFLCLHDRHGFIRPYHLIARDEIDLEVMARADAQPALNGEALPAAVADLLPMDLRDLPSAVAPQREEAIRKRLEEKSRLREQFVTLEQVQEKHKLEFQESEFEAWENEPPHVGQLKALERFHVDANGGIFGYKQAGTKPLDLDSVRTFGQARRLIALCCNPAARGIAWASQEQWAYMRWRGYAGDRPTVGDARVFFAGLNRGKGKRKNKSEGVLV